ncbi:MULTISPECIES: hydroxypyruvate isomerase family protein [Sphingobium]|jgi:hydroxypyruvate isomerase|uniref:TIM barrel protein n=1 Tax=Sphingobium yanoikuyae TaxID=13690 RepID=A0A9X7YE75_SPHYA|nr:MULTISPECIES: TIM barrel protein [Sphingobium]MBR2267673.1 TIM barrel protein [Sphingobium sp.]PZU63655.1 MAG: hydroxypyruvate isomerase [Sphingobium sp.]QNG46868.1 TIM barrel protein [Sphingobium yanoikuyae]
MYLSACIEWLFKDSAPDFADRIHAAKNAGLSAVEFHLWDDKPIDAIRAALDETGVKLTSFCVGPRRSLVDPAQHDEFLEAVAATLETAKTLGRPPLVVASGFTREGVSLEEQRAEAVKALKQAAALAEEAGVVLVLEPLNTIVSHPGMFLSSTTLALDIIEEVGSDHLRLLYDVFHSNVMGEDMEAVLKGRIHLVQHVQFADNPGRNEPGTGTIDWPAVVAQLRALGYDDGIGLEYQPTLPSDQSIAQARAATGL